MKLKGGIADSLPAPSSILNVDEVFYAGLASNGTLYISKRTHDTQEKHSEHGIE